MFDYAIKRHLVRFDPAAAFDLADAGGKELARERALSRDELVTLFEAMRQLIRSDATEQQDRRPGDSLAADQTRRGGMPVGDSR